MGVLGGWACGPADVGSEGVEGAGDEADSAAGTEVGDQKDEGARGAGPVAGEDAPPASSASVAWEERSASIRRASSSSWARRCIG